MDLCVAQFNFDFGLIAFHRTSRRRDEAEPNAEREKESKSKSDFNSKIKRTNFHGYLLRFMTMEAPRSSVSMRLYDCHFLLPLFIVIASFWFLFRVNRIEIYQSRLPQAAKSTLRYIFASNFYWQFVWMNDAAHSLTHSAARHFGTPVT